MTERVSIQKKVLSENDRLAGKVRNQLRRYKVASLNLVSSPGAGKTSLLEKTLAQPDFGLRVGLIAGDVQTENDARRLRKAGGTVVLPLVTGGACHLDARMITGILDKIDLEGLDLLVIENVGNLVCPSSYDLGEQLKVVLISTTEGDDKPLKYPAMFRRSGVMVVNKIDLLGLSDFSVEAVKKNARQIHPELEILEMSCRTGEGLVEWFDWLRNFVTDFRQVCG
jgi:hydrogenase nickel incorporation protein HypB